MKPIQWQIYNDFEIYIMDLAEAHDIKTKEELEFFADRLHEHLETAIQDYAMDEDIEDYDPCY